MLLALGCLEETERANGPAWSSDEAKAMSPERETRPYVGFSPTTPHSDAGWRMLPPVSVPIDQTASPAATAAALPPDDPPGTLPKSHGLRVGNQAEFSVDDPMANSSRLVLPSIGRPAASRRSATVAE